MSLFERANCFAVGFGAAEASVAAQWNGST